VRLQQIRFGDDVKVNLHLHIGAPEKTIEPMILVPFVENAFKHGTTGIDHPEINVSLISDDRSLYFTVNNTYNPAVAPQGDDHGIGLANVKRRLALLYPGMHKLTATQDARHYAVNLQIQFK
jgi:LytS/YehU family sensor histidine kinase